MAGIEDIIEIFRGENIKPIKTLTKNRTSDYMLKNKTLGAPTIGKYATTDLEYAKNYANKFPNVIKSAKISSSELDEGMKRFNKLFGSGTAEAYESGLNKKLGLQVVSDEVKDKLKVDVLRTLQSNVNSLSKLAMKGLTYAAGLPAQTFLSLIGTSDLNSDEVNMKLEDFAKLREMESNVDKALPSEPKDIGI